MFLRDMKPLVVLLLLCLIGCSSSNGPASNTSIMPLVLGNEWIGEVNVYDTKGALASTYLDTLRVERAVTVNGEKWYYMNVPGFVCDTFHAWFVNRVDGLYTCDSGHFSKAYRLAKYPALPHDEVVTFANTFDSNGNGYSSGIMVDTTDLLIHVPAGTFTANLYRGYYYSRSSDVTDAIVEPASYYSPGVGLIAWGYINPDGTHDNVGPDRTWQLVRAELH